MQTMRKSNIRRGILAAVLTGGLALSAVSAFAETVVLTGTVEAINTIVSTPSGNTFNVANAGFPSTSVATLKETSNITAGYHVTLLSTSTGSGTAFKLQSAGTGSATPITYTVKYGPLGSESDVAITTAGTAVDVTSTTAPTVAAGVDKVLKIAVASGGTYNAAADYTDTI